MTNDLSLALQNIRKAAPENIVAQVYALFLILNKMDESSIRAAYQTLRFFRRDLPLEDRTSRNKLTQIENVVVARMLAIVTEQPEQERIATAMSVKSLVDCDHHDKFDQLLVWLHETR
jgi:hypothetical protein